MRRNRVTTETDSCETPGAARDALECPVGMIGDFQGGAPLNRLRPRGLNHAAQRAVASRGLKHAAQWRRVVTRLVMACVVVLMMTVGAVAADDAATQDMRGVSSAESGSPLEAVMFYLVATGCVVSAIGVCVCKSVVRMAVFLFGALGSVALLYFLLAANFIGAIQLIVYAGGTLILLIFGVMLTSKSPWVRLDASKLEMLGAGAVTLAFLAALWTLLNRTVWPGTHAEAPGTSIAAIGESLLTEYLVPFEVAGVLLMIVMVGAAHLARQDK